MLWGFPLISSFVDERASDLLKTTHTAAHLPRVFDDWAAFYVNMYDLEYFESFHVSNLYSSFIDQILHACIILVNHSAFIPNLYSLDKPKLKITCTI